MINYESLISQAVADRCEKIVVGAVIFFGEAILFIKRADDDFMGGLWELPSGSVDQGERADSALRREIREETGLSIAVKSTLGWFDYTSQSGRKTRQLNFLCHSSSATVSLNPAEHSEFRWVTSRDELTALNLTRETNTVVTEAFGKNP